MSENIVWLGFDSEVLVKPDDSFQVDTGTQIVCTPVEFHIHRGWDWLICDMQRGHFSLMAASKGVPGSAFERDEYRKLEGVRAFQKPLQISESIRIRVINLTKEPQRFLASMRCEVEKEKPSECKCTIDDGRINQSRCIRHRGGR